MGLFLLLLVGAVCLAFWRRRPDFLSDLAKLLDRPDFVDGPAIGPMRRSFLKGEFRGRKMVIMLQNRRGIETVVVSMETRSDVSLQTYDFAGYRTDRESELALFALEVKHGLRLKHEARCLKAMWGPPWHALFLGISFDPTNWQTVLEGMHTMAGSIEGRAAIT
jgi:hypothetical protein